MKTSAVISHWPTPTAILQGPWRETIPRAAAIGFDGVQLTIASPEDYDLEELRQLVKNNNLVVTALATGRIYSEEGLSMGSGEEEIRRACTERLFQLAEFAKELGGAGLIIGACRGRSSDADSKELYAQQFKKSLIELTSYCEELGAAVLLEVIGRGESDAYAGIEETRSLLREINSPALKMYFDTQHLKNNGEDLAKALRLYGSEIAQLDISGEERRIPGTCGIDFVFAIAALKDSGFDGVLSFEVDGRQEEQAARKSLSYILDLWD